MTKHELYSRIFEIVKKGDIQYHQLYKLIDLDHVKIDKARNKLIKEYRLIDVEAQRLSISLEGEKHNSFDSCLKSLKKEPVSLYQKIHIGLTITSLLLVFIFGYLNYSLNQDKSDLKEQNVQLKSDLVLYKDSLSLYKEKPLLKKPITVNDTVNTKYSSD